MQKSNIWSALLPLSLCAALLIGLFIGRISSGDRILVEKPDATAPDKTVSSGEEPTEAPDALVNINTADASLLSQLPGIGPTIARRIVDHRQRYGPFLSIYELMAVDGIGEKVFQKLVPYITTGGQ